MNAECLGKHNGAVIFSMTVLKGPEFTTLLSHMTFSHCISVQEISSNNFFAYEQILTTELLLSTRSLCLTNGVLLAAHHY